MSLKNIIVAQEAELALNKKLRGVEVEVEAILAKAGFKSIAAFQKRIAALNGSPDTQKSPQKPAAGSKGKGTPSGRKHRVKVTPELEKKIKEFRKKHTIAEVAEMLNISTGTVTTHG